MNNNNDVAALLGVMLCVLVVALPVGLAIGAAILRAAIALANKVLGRPAEDRYDDRYDDDDDYDDYEDRPRRRARRRRSNTAVPEPGFWKAVGIVFVIALVNGGVGFVIGLVVALGMAGQDPQAAQIVSQVISLPVGFLINAGMLAAMLPTSFARGALVTLFQYLIGIAIAVVIGGVLFALLFAMAPQMGR